MISLKPIEDLKKEISNDYDQNILKAIARLTEEKVKTIKTVEQNYKVLPSLIEIVGEDCVEVPTWMKGEVISIGLGKKPTTKRAKRQFLDKLVRLRQLLGKMPLSGRDVESTREKLIRVTLCPTEFSGVSIRYYEKLGKTAKCKIVRVKHKAWTSSELVCGL